MKLSNVFQSKINSLKDQLTKPACLQAKFSVENYERIKEYCLTAKEIDLNILNSLYFSTMPDEYKIDLMRAVGEKREFAKALMSSMDIAVFLKASPEFMASFLLNNGDFDIVGKLAQNHHVSFLINLYNVFNRGISNEYFLLKIINILKGSFSKEEFEQFCIEANVSCHFIFDLLVKGENKELDSFANIMLHKKALPHPVYLVGKRKPLSPFEQFLNLLLLYSVQLTDEDKSFLVNKVIQNNDSHKMYVWVSEISWEQNKPIIDILLSRVAECFLLHAVSNEFVPYVIKKYMEGPEIDQYGMVTMDAIFIGEYPEEKLECILNSIYAINPQIKFSRETTLQLLYLGVSAFPKLITDYPFSDEERMKVLNKLKEAKKYDLCTYYGAYLLSGEESKLLSEERLLALRKDANNLFNY